MGPTRLLLVLLVPTTLTFAAGCGTSSTSATVSDEAGIDGGGIADDAGTDGGCGFVLRPMVTLETAVNESTATLVLDATGAPHLLVSGGGSLAHVTMEGGTPKSESVVTSSTASDLFGQPMTASFDANGVLHVAFLLGKNAMHAWRTTTWNQEVIAADVGTAPVFLALDSRGHAHAVYLGKLGTAVYANDVSGAWSSIALPRMACGSGQCVNGIAVGPDDVPHVSMVRGTVDATTLLVGVPSLADGGVSDGGAFAFDEVASSTPAEKSTPTELDTGSTLAVDGRGAHVLFSRGFGGGGVHYGTNVGGTWKTSVVAESRAKSIGRVAVDPSGGVHVVYTAESVPTYAKKVGDAFVATRISSDVGQAYSVVLDAAGTPHVGYRRNHPGGTSTSRKADFGEAVPDPACK
ncbi:MAG: hypothetical protein U0169_04800 [Polyangiaceae bacterium]